MQTIWCRRIVGEVECACDSKHTMSSGNVLFSVRRMGKVGMQLRHLLWRLWSSYLPMVDWVCPVMCSGVVERVGGI